MKLIVTRKNHNRIEKDGTRKAYSPGEFFEGSEAELTAFSDRLDAYQEPEFSLEQEQDQDQDQDQEQDQDQDQDQGQDQGQEQDQEQDQGQDQGQEQGQEQVADKSAKAGKKK